MDCPKSSFGRRILRTTPSLLLWRALIFVSLDILPLSPSCLSLSGSKRYTTCVALLLSRYTCVAFFALPYVFAVSRTRVALHPLKCLKNALSHPFGTEPEPETGTVGTVFLETENRIPEPPEPFSRNRSRPFLWNCTETQKDPFGKGTENRNRSNRSTPKP